MQRGGHELSALRLHESDARPTKVDLTVQPLSGEASWCRVPVGSASLKDVFAMLGYQGFPIVLKFRGKVLRDALPGDAQPGEILIKGFNE